MASSDKDSSLEIKYRPKKTKEKEEKEVEPESDNKPEGDGSSTPQPRMDRRRGSQVISSQSLANDGLFIALTDVETAPSVTLSVSG